MNRFILLTIALLTVHLSVLAQNTGALKGKIQTQKGEDVAGLSVGLAKTTYSTTWGYAVQYGRHFLTQQRTVSWMLLSRNDSLKAVFGQKFTSSTRLDTVHIGKGGALTNSLTTEDYLGQNVAVNYTTGLVGLCIGGPDLWPLYRKVTARSLYYDGQGVTLDENYGELTNPQKLLAGNFDLAFVCLYLLPLLIIALGYNVLSGETDLGTLSLLQTAPVSVRWLVGSRLAIWFGGVSGLIVVLSTLGLWLVGGNLSAEWQPLLVWIGVVASYAGFWFAGCFLCAACRWSSPVNALALVAGWLLVLLVIPALVNAYVTLRYPVTNRVALLDLLRKRTGDVWEMPNAVTYGAFFKAYPQYRKVVPDYFPEGGYERMKTDQALRHFYDQKFMVWHYYLTAVADSQTKAYQRQRENRFRGGEALQWLNPAVLTQETLTNLAGSGYRQYEAFSRQTTAYQRQLFTRSTALAFREKPLAWVDYRAYPAFRFVPRQRLLDGLMVWPLAFLSSLLVVAGLFLLNRRTRSL